MAYAQTVGRHRYVFDDLRTLLARASPDRSGDRLAGLAAGTEEERVAARMALATFRCAAFSTSRLSPAKLMKSRLSSSTAMMPQHSRPWRR